MFDPCADKRNLYDEGYSKGREEGRNIAASIEGELSAKCEQLKAENAKLELANGDLAEKLRQYEHKFIRYKAIIETLEVITGRKFE